jgi:hypothetical protein
LHACPVALHPGLSEHRSTPSGTLRQAAEQQSSFDWQRSSFTKHPPAPAHRPSPPQTPEQQFLASVQRSAMTLQPGKALQMAAPLAVTWQSPEQQSVPLPHVSPATRQPPSSRQPVTPSASGPHWPPQQSSWAEQLSPATRQPGAGAAHLPLVHTPEQQSLAVEQAAFS